MECGGMDYRINVCGMRLQGVSAKEEQRSLFRQQVRVTVFLT